MAGAPVRAAILAALPQEVRPFLRLMGARRLPGGTFPVWEFAFAGRVGVTAVSGMGGKRAASHAALLLAHYQPRVIIAAGFGGALTPDVPPGGLVLGERFWRYEPETGRLQAVTGPEFPASPADVLARLRGAGLTAFQGSVITTGGIIIKASQGDPLRSLSHPVLDLETAALVDFARDRGVPLLALRAITDAAHEEIPAFIREAAGVGQTPALAAILAWTAADPRRLAALVHLWRRSRLAAATLAWGLRAVLEVL
jgi:adenosylhomocysteine nucleosidase